MTASSPIFLNLGQVPEQIADPILYEALDSIHTALEILAQSLAVTEGTSIEDYLAQQLSVRAVLTSYLMETTDGTILVSGISAPVTVTLPPIADALIGGTYTVKCVDATFTVKVQGTGSDAIDDETGGIELNKYDSITVKSNGTKWWII